MILRGVCLADFLGFGIWDAEQRLIPQEVPPATLRGRWQLKSRGLSYTPHARRSVFCRCMLFCLR